MRSALICWQRQLPRLLRGDLASPQVKPRLEPEPARAARTDADPGSDLRSARVNVSALRDREQRRPEARRVADGEQLLRVRPRPVIAAHRRGNREIDLEPAIAGAAVTRAAALDERFGRVEDALQLGGRPGWIGLPTWMVLLVGHGGLLVWRLRRGWYCRTACHWG